MKKLLKTSMVLLVILSMLLTACAKSAPDTSSDKVSDAGKETGEDTNTKDAAASDADAGEVVTLKWAYWIPEPKEIIEAFNSSHSNIKIEYDMISSDQYINIVNTRLMAGEGPDIFAPRFFDNYAQLAADGRIVELTGKEFLQNYDQAALDQLTIDGKVYGIPDSVLWYLVFYNKEIFAKYNLEVPTNWEDYMAVCEQLKSNGVSPQIQGMKDLFQNVFVALDTVIASNMADPDWYNGLYTGESKFTDQVYVDASKRVEDFLKKGYLHEASIGVTMAQAWQLFCEGEAAMMQGGTYYSSQTFPEYEPQFDFGVFTVPYNKKGETPKIAFNAIAGNNVINADSEHVEEALEFFEWLAQPENLTLYSNTTQTLSAGKDIQADFRPEIALYTEMFNHTEKVPVVKIPTALANISGKLIQDMIMGQTTAEKMAEDLQKEFDASK